MGERRREEGERGKNEDWGELTRGTPAEGERGGKGEREEEKSDVNVEEKLELVEVGQMRTWIDPWFLAYVP